MQPAIFSTNGSEIGKSGGIGDKAEGSCLIVWMGRREVVKRGSSVSVAGQYNLSDISPISRSSDKAQGKAEGSRLDK